jgi:hypothetical protein
MTEQSELHNRIAGKIVKDIVGPVLDHDGSTGDILVLTESVVLGVMLVVLSLGADEKVLDMLVEGVKRRLAEQRLQHAQPAGRA